MFKVQAGGGIFQVLGSFSRGEVRMEEKKDKRRGEKGEREEK